MTKSKIRFYARRLLNNEPIPFFVDRQINKAIDDEMERIINIRTQRKYKERKNKMWM